MTWYYSVSTDVILRLFSWWSVQGNNYDDKYAEEEDRDDDKEWEEDDDNFNEWQVYVF